MEKNKFPFILDIQRFSIHDGPGIRTVLFTKGCPLNCKWCQNPESIKSKAEIAFYSEECNDCKKCIEICPNKAIHPITKISDYSACTQCGACINVCDKNSRRMIGKKLTKQEIIKELLADIDFYSSSSGGVTFSGGEPFSHTEFLFEIIQELKENNIHINIETCGYFSMDKVNKLLPYVDLIYFDIKHLNNESHKEYTGQKNDIILNNFRNLSSIFKNVQARMPLIPGVNDNEGHIKLVCGFLSGLGHDTVHLLPYQSMGNSKAMRIDYQAELFKAGTHNKEAIKIIQSHFAKYNVKSIVYE